MISNLSILYLGVDSGTSRHRVNALRRLGHSVCVVDPESVFPNRTIVGYWMHHAGGAFVAARATRLVLNAIGSRAFDLAFVNGGMLVDHTLVKELKGRCGAVINYNNDDPFSPRDGGKWRTYIDALPFYNLAIVVRQCNVGEALAAGARDVLRVYMSADEVAHSPRPLTKEDEDQWGSTVAFIGTWMPERGPFLARLIKLGVPLAIFGDRWHKAADWPLLRAHWRGPGIFADDDYAKAVQCAGVCLGLLSKGNRDLSTTRSFEIPHLGGVLCAERTPEHVDLYHEDVEAVFWDGPEECAGKCTQLLGNPGWRRRIARNGRSRCIENQTLNEPTMANALLRAALSTAAKLSAKELPAKEMIASA
jgi:spore maturation protein CgeB